MLTANSYIELSDGSWKRRDGDENNQIINQINPIKIVDDSTPLESETSVRKKLGFTSAKEILQMHIEPLTPLWGPFIYRGCVILLNGKTGVGKTTFLYSLLICAATGTEFAGIRFESPLKVIFGDLETTPPLRQTKLQRICEGEGPDNLLFVPRDLKNFPNNLEAYKAIVLEEKIDILVLDTISEAFDPRDENDNAEAVKQFSILREFSLDTGCTIIATHHTGKGASSETDVFAGRGATARADKVDIVLNLFPLKEDSDILCLAIGKDKIAGNDFKLFLKKAGDDMFEVVERQDEGEATQFERCKEFILNGMENEETTTMQIQTECQKAGFSQPTVTRVLSALVDSGRLKKTRRGYYQKLESSEKDTGNDDLIFDSTASTQIMGVK